MTNNAKTVIELIANNAITTQTIAMSVDLVRLPLLAIAGEILTKQPTDIK